MKNKKYIRLSLIGFFSGLLILNFLFLQPKRTKRSETYLKSFSRANFYNKLKKAPNWMNEQIQEDFSCFEKSGIDQKSILSTIEKIKKVVPSGFFDRYRIVDNKVYKYRFPNEEFSFKEPCFEKALKTLTQVIKLPDIDFIATYEDGIPLEHFPDNFYLVDNKEFQAPILSRAKIENTQYVILIPDAFSVSKSWADFLKNKFNKISWSSKKNIAFWRGGSHDKTYTLQNYTTRPRYILSKLSQSHPQLVDAGLNLTDAFQFEELFESQNLLKPFSTIEEHLQYKYLPVMDGFMCTYPGYQWRLLSNSVAFKQKSNEIQWFYRALKEFQHYVPIENDMSDLVEKIKWATIHDDECKRISDNATKFVLENLSLEDVYVYLYKVFMEYSKYQKFDKKTLENDLKKDSNWKSIQNRKKLNKALGKKK